MRNITTGFRGYRDFEIEAQTVIDGVRFFRGDDGSYGMMDAEAEIYMDTTEESLFMMKAGLLQGPSFIYHLEDKDKEARELTDGERSDLKAYFGFMTHDMWVQVNPDWELAWARL